MKTRTLFLLLFAALLAARLCHSGIVWAEEALPLAAAVQLQHGGTLYRDMWFDKPPLLAWLYLGWGTRTGWVLRVAGALYGLLACALAWVLARDLWGEREARLAAALLAFFLIFGLPSAVTPLAGDLLMLAPHLAAVWLARRRPVLGGMAAGVAFLLNPKGVLAAAACVLWNPGAWPGIACGFALALSAAGLRLWWSGALASYWEQVWLWGGVYAGDTFLADPVRNGLLRVLNWLGFHAALGAAAATAFARGTIDKRRWAAWVLLALAGAAAGMRFFPRYFFLLLPVAVLLAARGFAVMPRRRAAVCALLLLIPLARFGPRYALLAGGRSEAWDDIAMDRDSRAAGRIVSTLARPGDTLLVWGFRPEVYAYTRLPAASRFLDSQPLTGVPADRHLNQSSPVDGAAAGRRREELARSRPSLIVDGLGPYNPALAIAAYPDLRPWLAGYREAARTRGSIVYQAVR